ncbi:hypothetical protein VIGAN_06090300, partial [Vigna angularis var. angularis]
VLRHFLLDFQPSSLFPNPRKYSINVAIVGGSYPWWALLSGGHFHRELDSSPLPQGSLSRSRQNEYTPLSIMAIALETQFHVLAVDGSLIDKMLIERLLKTSSFISHQGSTDVWKKEQRNSF